MEYLACPAFYGDLMSGILQNGFEQTGKAGSQIFVADGQESLFSVNSDMNQTRFAQNLKMMGECRFLEFDVAAGAGHFAFFGKLFHDLQPDGITKGVQYR